MEPPKKKARGPSRSAQQFERLDDLSRFGQAYFHGDDSVADSFVFTDHTTLQHGTYEKETPEIADDLPVFFRDDCSGNEQSQLVDNTVEVENISPPSPFASGGMEPPTPIPSPIPGSSGRSRTRRRGVSNPRSRYHNRDRLDAQFQEAKEDFIKLQRANTSAMKNIADAMQKMAEYDSRRLAMEEKRFVIEEQFTALLERLCGLVGDFFEKK